MNRIKELFSSWFTWKYVAIILLFLLGAGFGIWQRTAIHKVIIPRDFVYVNLTYDTNSCPPDYPLLVVVDNQSFKTVKLVSFYLIITAPKHSANLAYGLHIDVDNLLGPKESYQNCYKSFSGDNPSNTHFADDLLIYFTDN